MSSDNHVTLIGNATRDPELKFTQSGLALCGFGLAVNRRWQNRQTQQWEEKVSFIDVVCWGKLAENVSESIEKGSRIIVVGRFDMNEWETDAGEKRRKIQLVADAVGPSLQWATAEISRNPKEGGGAAIYQEPDFGYGDFGGGSDEEPF
jgi:single-strand DNA-binding protein